MVLNLKKKTDAAPATAAPVKATKQSISDMLKKPAPKAAVVEEEVAEEAPVTSKIKTGTLSAGALTTKDAADNFFTKAGGHRIMIEGQLQSIVGAAAAKDLAQLDAMEETISFLVGQYAEFLRGHAKA